MSQLASVIRRLRPDFPRRPHQHDAGANLAADGRGLTRRLVPFFLAVGVIAAQVGYGNWRLTNTLVETRTDVRMRLVQPVVYEHVDWATADPGIIIDRLIGLTETRLTPDDIGVLGVTHVVWPESVFPFFSRTIRPRLPASRACSRPA